MMVWVFELKVTEDGIDFFGHEGLRLLPILTISILIYLRRVDPLYLALSSIGLFRIFLQFVCLVIRLADLSSVSYIGKLHELHGQSWLTISSVPCLVA